MNNLNPFRFSLLLVILVLFTTPTQAQLTTFDENFSSYKVEGWYGNSHYALIEGYREITASMNKQPWEAFTLALREVEHIKAPYMRFKIKSSSDIRLRIDYHNKNFTNLEDASRLFVVKGNGNYTEVIYEFPQIFKATTPDGNEVIDESDLISHILFYVNPGENFAGDVSIKDLYVGSLETDAPDVQPNLVVFPNPTNTRVNIDIPEGTFTHMELYDMAGRKLLYKDVSSRELEQPESLDVRSLKKGIYLLSLVGPLEVRSARVVVQ